MTETPNVTETPNALEQALLDAKAGRASIEAYLKTLMEATVYVPTTQEVGPEAPAVHPLVFEHHGTALVAGFTSLDYVSRFQAQAKYCISMTGREFLAFVPDGHGVVINPGDENRSEIAPASIAGILRQF